MVYRKVFYPSFPEFVSTPYRQLLRVPRGCRRPYTSSANTARAEAGGIQGGPPPCAGGPGTRRFLAYLCLLSLREKVGRGAGRSARSGECRGAPAPRKEAGSPHPSVERKNYSSKKYAAPATSASWRRHSFQSGKKRSTSRQKAALWS